METSKKKRIIEIVINAIIGALGVFLGTNI